MRPVLSWRQTVWPADSDDRQGSAVSIRWPAMLLSTSAWVRRIPSTTTAERRGPSAERRQKQRRCRPVSNTATWGRAVPTTATFDATWGAHAPRATAQIAPSSRWQRATLCQRDHAAAAAATAHQHDRTRVPSHRPAGPPQGLESLPGLRRELPTEAVQHGQDHDHVRGPLLAVQPRGRRAVPAVALPVAAAVPLLHSHPQDGRNLDGGGGGAPRSRGAVVAAQDAPERAGREGARRRHGVAPAARQLRAHLRRAEEPQRQAAALRGAPARRPASQRIGVAVRDDRPRQQTLHAGREAVLAHRHARGQDGGGGAARAGRRVA